MTIPTPSSRPPSGSSPSGPHSLEGWAPPGRPELAWRGLACAGLMLSAAIHLELYIDGFSDIAVVGPLFMVNAIAGIALGLLIMVWRHWLPLLGAVGFSVATLAAFYLSATVGFFDVHETLGGAPQVLAAVAEWVTLVAAVVAGILGRTSPTGPSSR